MSSKDCIFCKIIAGDIPSFVIHENDDFIAILDIAQFTEGHTIVLPKEHHRTIWDVPDIGAYYTTAQEVADHYRSMGFKYVDTLTFGRMVPHAHIHVVPHNNDSQDWESAIEVIGEYQQDSSRHPTEEEGKNLVEKYRMG